MAVDEQEGPSGGEMVDVVDADDRVVGQATRAEVRRRNLLHRAVYVLVFDSRGEILVHRRTETKDIYPGRWDVTIGGVVAAGEDYRRAATRELAEELGVVVADVRPFDSLRYADDATQVMGEVFVAVHDGPFVTQPEEVAEARFVSLADAERMTREQRCCPDGVRVLRAYLARHGAVRPRSSA